MCRKSWLFSTLFRSLARWSSRGVALRTDWSLGRFPLVCSTFSGCSCSVLFRATLWSVGSSSWFRCFRWARVQIAVAEYRFGFVGCRLWARLLLLPLGLLLLFELGVFAFDEQYKRVATTLQLQWCARFYEPVEAELWRLTDCVA